MNKVAAGLLSLRWTRHKATAAFLLSFLLVATYYIVSPPKARGFINPSVVVNKYLNGTPDVVELLVIQDGLDMRGMILKDFSASMVNDGGGKYQFTTASLWSSIPAGTLIVLRNNNTAADVTVGSGDYNLDVGLQNTTYFSNQGGTFDIATTEMVMIKAAGSGAAGVTGSIHVLAGGTAGAQFTAAPTPKLIASSGSGTNQFVFANNSTQSINDYDGTDATGAATGLTFGSGNNANNTAFINSLRGGPLSLSINNVSQAEGNSGTTSFIFTVSLSQPAPAGGVTFDIATQDNTATVADNDYVSQSLTGQTIPEGNQNYMFTVTVNGDTVTEPNETFFVNVTNVTGATVVDGQGQGTIVNDDITTTPIYTIQGSGTTSPFAGSSVTTSGIVTAVKTNGFFLQDATGDGNTATSDGVFVFTSSAPPGTAAVGNSVLVTGTVQEFIPSADPNSPPTTEIISPSVTLFTTGNPLPAAVTITAADTLNNSLSNLEKYEGMRVHADSLTTIAPTQGTITEASATVTSNGVFYAVITGVPRPFREAGIETPDPAPTCSSGPPCSIPVFDANPERLRVDSDGQVGAASLEVTSGATLTNVTGVLDYGFRTYTILPDVGNQTQVGVVGNVTFTAVPTPTASEFTIASFNMQRFYDTTDDPSVSDVVLTSTAFNNRLAKASLVIRNVLRSPDIIGVEEMENLPTLQAVASKVNADTVSGGGTDPQYVAYLQEGNDIGGIDVGFLVKTAPVVGSTPRVGVITVVQESKNTLFVNADSSTELLNDRPPLRLMATVNFANGTNAAVTVIANHLRSLNGVDDTSAGSNGWPTVGARVRAKRRAQAEDLANLVQARQVADANERIMLVGDFNAFDVNDGYVDSMGTIKGTPTPANQVVLASSDLVNPDFMDLLGQINPADQRYSYSFDGNAQTLDHELVNPNMFALFSRMAYGRNNADFPQKYYEDATRPERLSDHDIAVAYFFAQAPTAVKLESFSATAQGNEVLLRWQTGEEADNLGFNLYREEAGARVRVTPQIVAGSALVANPGTTLTAGRSYSWWDAQARAGARYWLEAIDLNGKSLWHGPVTVKASSGKKQSAVADRQAVMLNALGRDQIQESATRPVEVTADDVQLAAKLPAGVNLGAQSAVKIAVNREGWYRITQSELVRAGLDPNANPRMLQLYVDGREQPILVTSKSGAAGGPADAIEFYGVGLDTAATNTRVYWLVAGTQPGQRVEQIKGAGLKGSPASFAYTVERRDRTIYFSGLRNGDRENFFGPVVTRTPVNQSITLQHFAAQSAEPATVEVTLQGVTASSHRVSILLNGTAVGAATFDGQASYTARVNVASASLKEGENVVSLAAQAGDTDISLIEAVRVTYPHSFTADNNALRLMIGSKQSVTIDGFTSNAIRVFDVTNTDAPQEVIGTVKSQKNGYGVTVTATGGGTRRLLAITNDQAQRSPSVTANQPSAWRQAGQSADLVIITTGSLIESARQLQAYRESRGLRVALVDVEDIYDEFSFGNKSAYAVRDFLAYAQENWQRAPQFVLLMGDATYDPKNYLGHGDFDLVPTKLIDTQTMETASDDWLADFEGKGFAAMAVGRLPARGADEAMRMIAKIIGYESAAASDSALIVSDSNDGFDFEGAGAQLRELFPASVKAEQIDRGELGTAAAKKALLDGLQRGQRIVNYIGHGSADTWRDGLLTSAEARGLTNGDRLPLFVAMTCLNGYFQDTSFDSLAESLMKAERGGAIAVWASSGMTLPGAQSRMNQQLLRLMFDADTPQGKSLGAVTLRAKSAVSDSDVRRTWILFGDPTTTLR